MARLADGLDFLSTFVSTGLDQDKDTGDKQTTVVNGQRTGSALAICYALFSFIWVYIFGLTSSKDFSAIITAAAFCQCFGFTILHIKVRATKSVAGISSKMLTMFVLMYCLRLTSTSIKNGYIPVDRSGDYVYQVLDFVSLCLCGLLLFRTHKMHAYTYQDEYDTLPLLPLLIPCFVVGYFIHGSFNKNEFFDVVWQVSTNVEAFCLLPQLWMFAKMGGKVDGMNAHFVAACVASYVMQGTFWYWTACELEKRGPNVCHQLILGLQGVKLILSADFMYYYTIAWLGGTDVTLPVMEEEL